MLPGLPLSGSTLDVTGATTLSSTLGVAGATTLSSTLDVTGLTTTKQHFEAPVASLTDTLQLPAATISAAILMKQVLHQQRHLQHR